MPNMVVLAIGFLIGLVVLFSSAHEHEKNWKPSGAEHEIIDNQPGAGEWVLVAIVALVFVLVAFH